MSDSASVPPDSESEQSDFGNPRVRQVDETRVYPESDPSDLDLTSDDQPTFSQSAVGKRGKLPGPGDNVRYFGDYELLSELARGGMGVVYRAQQRTLGRTVALKMILAGNLATDSAVRRFRIEAEAAATLDHPHVVPIYEIGEQGGLHYFSMKFIQGRSLAAITKSLVADPTRTARLMAKVARAVGHAHQRGILHRDLKPANILIDEEGEPHVTDFGLAKFVTDSQTADGPTLEGSVMGTPSYMSPEQADGKTATLTTGADIWGLGAILYDCLTGEPPYKGDSALATVAMVRSQEPRPPVSRNAQCPRDLAIICMKCLQKDPAKRYATAEALAQDLENWLVGLPITARPVGRGERLLMWARRRPGIAALSAATLISAVGGFVGILWQWNHAVRARNAEVEARRIAEQRTAELQVQTREVRQQLNRADLLRGRMLMQAGESVQAESALWVAALGAPGARERLAFTTAPLSAGPLTAAEWTLWELYRKYPRDGTLGGLRATSMSTSEDGRILGLGYGVSLTAWDWETSRALRSVDGPTVLFSDAAMNPSGSLLARHDFVNGSVYVYTTHGDSTGSTAPLAIIPVPTTSTAAGAKRGGMIDVCRAVFCGDHHLILHNSVGVELRDVRTGSLVAQGRAFPTTSPEGMDRLVLHPAPLREVGGVVALATVGDELRSIRRTTSTGLEWSEPLPLGDAAGAPRRQELLMAQARQGMRVALQTASGDLLAGATDGTSIAVVMRRSGSVVPRLAKMNLSPSGRVLTGLVAADRSSVSGKSGHAIHAWSFPDLTLLRVVEAIGDGPPAGLASTPDDRRLVVMESDGTVALYSLEPTGDVVHRGQPTAIGGGMFDVGTTGSLVYAAQPRGGGEGKVLELWQENRRQIVPRPSETSAGVDMRIQRTDDGRNMAIVVALPSGPALEWYELPLANDAAPQITDLGRRAQETVYSMGLSGTGNRCVVVTDSRVIIVGRERDGRGMSMKVLSEQPIATWVNEVVVDRVGHRAALGVSGGVLLMDLDARTSQPVMLGAAGSGMFYNMAFSPDGSMLALPGRDRVSLVDTRICELLRKLVPSRVGLINAAAFSPDGRLLATGSRDGKLVLWNPETGDELATLDPSAGAIMQVAFAADGRAIRYWGERNAGQMGLSSGRGRLAANLRGRIAGVWPELSARLGDSEASALLQALRTWTPELVDSTWTGGRVPKH